MTDQTPSTEAAPRVSSFRSRFRTPLIFAAVVGWAVFITVAYLRPKGGDTATSTSKGATELLEIGALPVT